jgi:hypothetical protein
MAVLSPDMEGGRRGARPFRRASVFKTVAASRCPADPPFADRLSAVQWRGVASFGDEDEATAERTSGRRVGPARSIGRCAGGRSGAGLSGAAGGWPRPSL